MADKNIQMTQRNSANTGWDNLFPLTKSVNVTMGDSTTVEAKISSLNTSIGTKAPTASPTFTGTPKAPVATDYTTTRIRNAYFSTTIPTTMNNGEICFVYE